MKRLENLYSRTKNDAQFFTDVQFTTDHKTHICSTIRQDSVRWGCILDYFTSLLCSPGRLESCDWSSLISGAMLITERVRGSYRADLEVLGMMSVIILDRPIRHVRRSTTSFRSLETHLSELISKPRMFRTCLKVDIWPNYFFGCAKSL